MPKKILVVDDEPQVAGMIGTLLEEAGYAVTVASFFSDAIQKAQTGHPDLVLADVVMPDSSGFEICRKVKEILKTNPPRVILMTAKLTAFDPVLAREMGADDFVVKTANMAMILRAVKKMLDDS